jgi:hypothetical protein
MFDTFNAWFRIGLLLFGLRAGLEAVTALVGGRRVWSWLLVADTVWHAGSLGLAAVGIAWLATSPDLVPPLVALYGTAGALAVGALWGALVAAAERRAWAVLWDGYLWHVPVLARQIWAHCRPSRPGRRAARSAERTPGVLPSLDAGWPTGVPGSPSPRRARRRTRRTAVDQWLVDDPLAPGARQEE